MRLFFLFVFPSLFLHCTSKQIMSDRGYRYLALGDSYTIGESVPAASGFPFQTVQLLKQKNILFQEPVIVAETGWTTGNLKNAIESTTLQPPFDIITLLIVVNNQYQGRSIAEYEKEFEELLDLALTFAGNDSSRVVVLSIPDWGSTPFGASRNRMQITEQIDAFNAVNKKISRIKGVHYINITPGSREALGDVSLVAADGLHPSAKAYARWAGDLSTIIEANIR